MTEKIDRDPSDLFDEFKEIVDENGFVKLDDYGAIKEPAARELKAKQVFALADQIMSHPNASAEYKEEVARRMEAGARDYLEGILNSGR